MWMEIRYRPNGGGDWMPDTFREFVAKQLDGAADPRLFWRTEDGKPLPGAPRITFVGTRKWVGLRIVGSGSDEEFRADSVAALKHANAIAVALDAQFGGLHAPEIKSGERSVTEKDYTRYHIRKLVLPRKLCRRKREELIAALPPRGSGEQRQIQPEHLELIKDAILKSLKEEFPEDAGLFFNGLKWSETEPPRWGTPLSVNGELVFNAIDLNFTLPVRLVGPVQVGALRSRGYGDIHVAMGVGNA